MIQNSAEGKIAGQPGLTCSSIYRSIVIQNFTRFYFLSVHLVSVDYKYLKIKNGYLNHTNEKKENVGTMCFAKTLRPVLDKNSL
jgi:hypothetical protein